MGKKPNNERRSKADVPPESATPKRRRDRLPVHADLRLDDSLAANQNHPLAQTAPEICAASRLRLIATILARLAGESLKPNS